MATIRKIKRSFGIVYRAEVARAGVRDSGTFDTKEEAAVWAAKREQEILHGVGAAPAPDKTFAEAVDRYVADVLPTHRGEAKERLRLIAINRDSGWSALPIKQITAATITDWRDTRTGQVKPASVAREMTMLHALFEVARKEWKWIDANPMKDVSKPRQPRHRERLIPQPEIDAVVAALGWADGTPALTVSQMTAVAFLLAIETAMRAGELLSLRWDTVDLTRRVADLSLTKNGDARRVPLSLRAVELFGYLPQTGGSNACIPINPGSRDTLFRKAVQKAGLSNLHFHDARAEALTRLSRRVDVLTLARIVGHRDPRSLMIYYRESAEDIAARLG